MSISGQKVFFGIWHVELAPPPATLPYNPGIAEVIFPDSIRYPNAKSNAHMAVLSWEGVGGSPQINGAWACRHLTHWGNKSKAKSTRKTGRPLFFASLQALTNLPDLPAVGYRARFEFPEKGSLYSFCCIVQQPSHLFKLASLHMSSRRLNLAVRTTSASCAPALSFPLNNVEGNAGWVETKRLRQDRQRCFP